MWLNCVDTYIKIILIFKYFSMFQQLANILLVLRYVLGRVWRIHTGKYLKQKKPQVDAIHLRLNIFDTIFICHISYTFTYNLPC